ncbi:plasmid pRiA4b ORF-3 family protein [Thiocystis minor]|uniref:plasmid pRiA4b ORF-3 family protein n=1 Tax=Thiocystis minor TaxID=61597 RepID=UPI001912425E|nr:plasmid pRiA4b ORF-3 family protein [Thiocystis minor]
MAKDPRKIYQLKIGLSGAKPPIWRRLLIVDTVPLPAFHTVLQIVMGWEDSHLHQFVTGGNDYGTPDPGDHFSETLNESRYKLNHVSTCLYALSVAMTPYV